MEKLHKLKDRLMDVLENDVTEQIMRKPSIGLGDIEMIHTLTDTIKNIDKICMLEEEGGYSEAVDGGDYGRGSSYANRGEHWVRGHYSRDGGGEYGGGYNPRRNAQGRYSRDDRRTAMMEHLEAALDSASEQDRENIKRFMRQMDKE